MNDIVNNYLNTKCTFYLLDNSFGVEGVIDEIHDGWITVDTGKEVQAINTDYLIRIVPKKEKKKK